MDRYKFALLAALLGLLMIAGCTGGGSGSSSSSSHFSGSASVSINLKGLPKSAEAALAGSAGMKAAVGGGPSFLNSVSLTISGSDMSTLSASADINGATSVTLTMDVPAGNSRVFHVDLLDAFGHPLYSGSATADILTASVSLNISIQDLIAKMFNDFAAVSKAKSPSLTDSDIDGFFLANATSFGVHDGYSRDDIFNADSTLISSGLIQHFISKFNAPGRALTQVTGVTITDQTFDGMYDVSIIAHLDDGSYYPMSYRLIYDISAYSGAGGWVFIGNGFHSDVYLFAYNEEHIDADNNVSFGGGVKINAEDPGQFGIVSICVTGPGVASECAEMDPSGNPFFLSSGSDALIINDATLAAIPDASAYTVDVWYATYATDTYESKDVAIPYTAKQSTALTSSDFATLVNSTADANPPAGHYFSSGPPTPMSFFYTMPSYTPANAEMEIFYTGNFSGHLYDFRADVTPDSTRVDLPTNLDYDTGGGYGLGSQFRARTTDSKFRIFRMIWDYVFNS